MVSTSLSSFFQRLRSTTPESQLAYSSRLQWQIRVMAAVFLTALALNVPDAMAQVAGMCQFANFLKQLATVAGIVALIVIVLNSFFLKNSVIGDIIMYVIIGCVIIVAATTIITATGLTTSCTLS